MRMIYSYIFLWYTHCGSFWPMPAIVCINLKYLCPSILTYYFLLSIASIIIFNIEYLILKYNCSPLIQLNLLWSLIFEINKKFENIQSSLLKSFFFYIYIWSPPPFLWSLSDFRGLYKSMDNSILFFFILIFRSTCLHLLNFCKIWCGFWIFFVFINKYGFKNIFVK